MQYIVSTTNNELPTTDVLLSTPNFSMLYAVLQHALQKWLMVQGVGVTNQGQVSPCSGDGHIATSHLLQKTTLT